jgi:hypothetical protein
MNQKIWLIALCLMVSSCGMNAKDTDDGFVTLFDGKTLSGWKGLAKHWYVKDGAITGECSKSRHVKHNTFLVHDKTFSNFELHFKYRFLTKGGNSGIQFRSELVNEKRFIVSGYQADVTHEKKYMGILYEEKGRGILARSGQTVIINHEGHKNVTRESDAAKKIMASIKPGEWVDYVIRAEGNHIVQIINGVKSVDVTDNQMEKARANGILAIQLHGNSSMTVQFRDIKIKNLSK